MFHDISFIRRLGVRSRALTRTMLVCFGMLVLAPGMAFAQTASGPPASLTLQDVVRLAMERNLDVMQGANQVEMGRTQVEQERADFLPDLNLSISPGASYGRSIDPMTGSTEGNVDRSLNMGASSSINLFNGFEDQATLDQAKSQLSASERLFGRTQEQIAYQAAIQYLDVFLNQELEAVAQENLDVQERQLEQIQAFYEAGSRPIADVLQQKAAIAAARQQLLAAQQAVEVARLELKRTLRLSAEDELELAEPSPEVFALQEDQLALNDLIARALENRSDLEAQRLQIDAAESGVKAARSGYYPRVDLGVGANTRYNSGISGVGAADQLFDTGPGSSVNLSVTIPIFDRNRTRSAVKRAEIAVDNERIALERAEQDIAFEVQKAVLDYNTAKAQLASAEEQVAAARQALSAAEARYNVGASTLVELAQTRSTFVQAEADRVNALYALGMSRLTLALQTGDVGASINELG